MVMIGLPKRSHFWRNFRHWCSKSEKKLVLKQGLHITAPLNGLLNLKRAYSSDLLLWFAGHAIKCYQCKSPKSWDTCVPENNTACASPLDSCVKFKIEGELGGLNVKYFYKGCALKTSCNQDGCKVVAQILKMKLTTCDVDCCETDLCNGAKVPMVSSFLFLACALVANFRWNIHTVVWIWQVTVFCTKFF